MTLKNNRDSSLWIYKLCHILVPYAKSNRVIIRKPSNRSQVVNYTDFMTLKFDRWPWKTIVILFYACRSSVRVSLPSVDSTELWYGNAQETPKSGPIQHFFGRRALEIRWMTLKIKRDTLLYLSKPCVKQNCHLWIQTKVMVRKHPKLAQIWFDLCDLDLTLTLTFCMDITLDKVDKPWKRDGDTATGTWSKRCDERTDRQTGPVLELVGRS